MSHNKVTAYTSARWSSRVTVQRWFTKSFR